MGEISTRKPHWLKTKVPVGKQYIGVREIVEKNQLHTICTSGHCPNMAECWGVGTATLMILGDICTRACKFCNVKTGRPLPADWNEPDRVAESIKKMGVKHAVITSVDRDDLDDGGAEIWALTIKKIKEVNPDTTIETLIPDFDGNTELIQKVIDAKPEVISHNLETVRRITPIIRSKARYERSLDVLEYIVKSGIRSKTGIMVGLGETEAEILETMDDVRQRGVEVFTIGQYLQPTRHHLSVKEFVTPEQFEKYRMEGIRKGFRHIESSPLVRSSYHAERHVK
ncbi:MAG TPA: lipoyl synthase [Bacteroidales bacterium]|nr:lipoyl synthase [Bacteroidales bacterium]HRX97618.1 lipoyl synthase [Bacteroidales bacterium]